MSSSPIGSVLTLNSNTIGRSRSISDTTYTQINTNSGNAYISYSVAKILGYALDDSPQLPTLWRPAESPREVIEASERVSLITLILQDQLRTSFPDEDYVFALQNLRMLSPNTPLVVFSLAANSMNGYDSRLVEKLSPARRRFFDYLAERSLSIGIRGEYTRSILEEMGIQNSKVVGCPSFFEMGPIRRVAHAKDRRQLSHVGMTGIFNPSNLGPYMRYLQGDFEWPGVKILHTPTKYWTNTDQVEAAGARTLTPDLLEDLADHRAYFFLQPAAWKAHIAEHCAAVGGSRLHGAIAALNAGVPAVVFNADARARESCEYLGIPHRPDLQHYAIDRATLESVTDPTEVNAGYDRLFETFHGWLDELGLGLAAKPDMAPERPMFRPAQREVSRRVVRTLSLRDHSTPPVSQAEVSYGANLIVDPTFAFDMRFWELVSSPTGTPAWTLENDEGGRQAIFKQDLRAGDYRTMVSRWIPY